MRLFRIRQGSLDYYFKKELSDPIEDIAYLKAKKVGMVGVAPEDIQGICADLSQQRRVRIVAVDALFAAPKSVSVLWAVADRADREKIINCHRAAVGSAISYFEHTDSARVFQGQLRSSDGLAGTEFVHLSSRNGDPHLHSHTVVLNQANYEGVGARALDLSLLSELSPLLEVVYRAELSHRLRLEVGVELQGRGLGKLTIAQIPDDLMTVMSSRRREVLGESHQYGSSPASRQFAVWKTREAKVERSLSELDGRWKEQAPDMFAGRWRERTSSRRPLPSFDPYQLQPVRSALHAEMYFQALKTPNAPSEQLLSTAIDGVLGEKNTGYVEKGVRGVSSGERILGDRSLDGKLAKRLSGSHLRPKMGHVSDGELVSQVLHSSGDLGDLMRSLDAYGKSLCVVGRSEAETRLLASVSSSRPLNNQGPRHDILVASLDRVAPSQLRHWLSGDSDRRILALSSRGNINERADLPSAPSLQSDSGTSLRFEQRAVVLYGNRMGAADGFVGHAMRSYISDGLVGPDEAIYFVVNSEAEARWGSMSVRERLITEGSLERIPSEALFAKGEPVYLQPRGGGSISIGVVRELSSTCVTLTAPGSLEEMRLDLRKLSLKSALVISSSLADKVLSPGSMEVRLGTGSLEHSGHVTSYLSFTEHDISGTSLVRDQVSEISRNRTQIAADISNLGEVESSTAKEHNVKRSSIYRQYLSSGHQQKLSPEVRRDASRQLETLRATYDLHVVKEAFSSQGLGWYRVTQDVLADVQRKPRSRENERSFILER